MSVCLSLFLSLSVSVSLSLSLSLSISVCLCLSYFADFVCCKVLDGNNFCFRFVLKMYFSLQQLFVFLFDVLSVAVFVIRDRFVNKI